MSQPMRSRSFFAELKRRNVYKVAVAYAIVGWLIIQITSTVLPTFHTPEWVVQTLVAVVILGFPIALVLAWAFELTPEGIKRAEDVAPEQSITRKTGRKLIVVTVLLAVIAACLLAFKFLRPRPATTAAVANASAPATAAITEKSIAVLPFESLSEDKANAYFADGIQEEILTRLAKIADLKVISRTSTQQYQSKPGNLHEIAKQLGAANILEGSVQKAADSVRVNVQLIRAATDSHLWADTYDRKLVDTFSVESEIAKAIAEQLQAKLTGREEEALSIKPTKNPEAYEAYLRGLAFAARSGDQILNRQKAVSFYKRAVQLDPNFALAWAQLSRVESFLYFNNLSIVRDEAERAMNAAEKLQPNAPETLLATGYYQYWVLKDREAAQATFEQVRSVSPGSSEVAAALAKIARRQGQWDKSIACYKQAVALDPRNSELLVDFGFTYSALRQFQAARKMYDRALDIEPNDADLMAAKAWTYQAEGDPERAGQLLASVDARTATSDASGAKITQWVLQRRYGDAIQALRIRISEFPYVREGEREGHRVWMAVIQRFSGDIPGATGTAREAQQALETLSKNEPDPYWRLLLSGAYAALGEKNAALKEAEGAVTLLPTSLDALEGPFFEENLARIEVMVGEKERAIQRLEHLLQIPYSSSGQPITPALLRLDPIWDPLRSDPRFQKLCDEKQQ